MSKLTEEQLKKDMEEEIKKYGVNGAKGARIDAQNKLKETVNEIFGFHSGGVYLVDEFIIVVDKLEKYVDMLHDFNDTITEVMEGKDE